VGVTRQTIIAIEKARFIPSTKLALEIASALDVAIDFLFWLEKT
jgi:DNA-binding XRE family transcriptional regulator